MNNAEYPESNQFKESESINVPILDLSEKHSSRMRTTRLLTGGGWVLSGLWYCAGCGVGTVPGGRGGAIHNRKCHHATPPPVNIMTDRCTNITLPQTSFAGSNYLWASTV